MQSIQPLYLRLSRSALARRDAVTQLAATWQERKLFAFKCDELEFARELLARRTNLWLYRTSQRAFAGDFIAIDVSSPDANARRAFVIELKLGEPIRLGAPTSVQLRNAPVALRELARREKGVVGDDCETLALTGDARAALAYFCQRSIHRGSIARRGSTRSRRCSSSR